MGKYLKGDNWYIDYYANGRRKREKIGPSRALAENVLRKRKVEIAENRYLDVKKESNTTLPELCELYLRLHSKPNKRSWKSDERRAKILCDFFGNRRLSEITELLVSEFKAKRSEKVAPATVNRELALLKHLFTKAIEWGKVQNDYSPAKRIKLYKENNVVVRYLEKDEMNRLIANASEHLRPILILAFNTGMRKGEILRLKWTDLDFKNNLVYIRQAKSGEARTVPMTEPVRRVLVGLLDERVLRRCPESPYLFCNNDGEPFGEVRKSFFTACRNSGIKNFRFHDTRHHFASHLSMRGVDLNTVRELLGHKDPRMTLRYAHLSPEHLHGAAAKINDLMDTQVDTKRRGEKEEILRFSQVLLNT